MTNKEPVVPQTVLDHYLSAYSTGLAHSEIKNALSSYFEFLAPVRKKLRKPTTPLIIAGPAGSGKSRLMRKIDDAICIDHERALRQFPAIKQIVEYHEGASAGLDAIRDESRTWLLGAKHNADVMLNTLYAENAPLAFETTGHGEGMADFLRNLNSPDMWLCDTPEHVRKAAITAHLTQEKFYVDPEINEKKIPGIGRNLMVFADTVSDFGILWRDEKDQPLRMIAQSDKNGNVVYYEPAGVKAFDEQSDVLKSSGVFTSVDQLLERHGNMRRHKQTNEKHFVEYFGHAVLA